MDQSSYSVITSSMTITVSSTTVPTADLILKKYKYRLTGSTDYFLPLFMVYAGSEGAGVAGAFYWQFSDMLGNHTLATAATYSSDDNYLNFGASYTYARWRPQFSFSAGGATGYQLNSDGELERVRQYQESFFVTYPLDRYHRLETGLANVDEMIRNRDRNNITKHDRANEVFASFTRDYTSGELFDINDGHRLSLSATLGRNLFGGDEKYDTYQFDWQTYWTYWERNVILATRLIGVDSNGRDFQEFSLGNRDNLRGYSDDDYLNGRIIGLEMPIAYRFPR